MKRKLSRNPPREDKDPGRYFSTTINTVKEVEKEIRYIREVSEVR